MKKTTIFLIALLVLLTALATVYFGFVRRANAVTAIALQDDVPVSAISADAVDMQSMNHEEQIQWLDSLVSTVSGAGCNTLYFTVNTPGFVCYRDKVFPQDVCFDYTVWKIFPCTFDALDYLAGECANADLRLIAVVDIDALFSAGSDVLADIALVDKLQDGLRTLSDYPISAITLRFDTAPADTPANRAVLQALTQGCPLPCGLELSADSTLLSDTLPTNFSVGRLTAEADPTAVRNYVDNARHLWLAKDNLAFSAANYYSLFYNTPMTDFVWGSVNAFAGDPEALSSLQAVQESDTLSLSLPEIGQTLAVSYPQDNATLYSAQVFVMGTSDPTQPLTVNGEEVHRTAQNGLFGVLVPLERGTNTITLAQGAQQVAVQVVRGTYSGGGTPSRDTTESVADGTMVQVVPYLCSVLSNPDSDDYIRETAKQGAIAEVIGCTTTIRNGKYTYIYELASGGYLLAYHCETVDDPGIWSMNAIPTVEKQESGDEYLSLLDTGTPLAYDNWDTEANTLSITLAHTTANAGLLSSGKLPIDSSMVEYISCEETDGGLQLTLSLKNDSGLWGYDIEYVDGKTRLFLKHKTALDADSAQPLRGATILLDAGHGADDTGAAGITGALGGPAEKDLNLAMALATRARLEQLGATVVMVREDDSFLSLEERSRLSASVHPDVYLALHHNSIELVRDANEVSGVEAYYYTIQGARLAECLLQKVSAATGRASDGAVWNYFYVNRMTYTPSVLFEYGFLVNPAELEDCCNPSAIAAAADATAMGILEYLTT